MGKRTVVELTEADVMNAGGPKTGVFVVSKIAMTYSGKLAAAILMEDTEANLALLRALRGDAQVLSDCEAGHVGFMGVADESIPGVQGSLNI